MGTFLDKISHFFKIVPFRPEKMAVPPHCGVRGLHVESILESISDGFISLDRNWKILYFNKAACSILSPGEVAVSKNFWEVFRNAAGSKFYHEYLRAMEEGIPATFEDHYPDLNLDARIKLFPSGEGISVFFRDITESKRRIRIETLAKDVLTYYTAKGSTIEGSLRLMMEGLRAIHPELLCSMMKVKDGRLDQWGFSHLPESFTGSLRGMPAGVFLKQKMSPADAANDPLWTEYRELSAENGLKSCYSFPLIDPYQKLLGAFTIYLKTARALTIAEEASLDRAKYILQHILENHIAEELIKVNEEKYRDLFYSHPLPLWLYDTETYRFLDVNDATVRNYGYSRDEFLQMTIKDIRPVEDLPLLENILLSNQSAGGFSCSKFRHKKKCGKLIYAEIRSNEIDFEGTKARLIIAADITEKVKIEEALHLSESRFKALVQEGSDLINIIDLNGVCKYASPASAALAGAKPENVVGTNTFCFIHPDDRASIRKTFSTIAISRRLESQPYRFRDHSGQYRWLQSIGTNLLDDPAIQGIVINSRDITESVKHIHAIEAQNSKLRDIAWAQSHLVRAPLSRILGLLNLIDNCPENEGMNTELLNYISKSAHELDEIVREIVRKTELVDQ